VFRKSGENRKNKTRKRNGGKISREKIGGKRKKKNKKK
jgi:hypothetical protein